MSAGKSLFDFPIHLGLAPKRCPSLSSPVPIGTKAYGERHANDLDEGRVVALYRFEEPWTCWEVHPAGDEVVCCIQGHMTLHQELPDGTRQSHELEPGDYAINPPGAWHTADTQGPVVALFITAGKGTEHRLR